MSGKLIRRVTLLSSAVVATRPACSCKTSLSATELIWMKVPLEFCYVASTASSEDLEHQTICYKSTGVYFLQVKLAVRQWVKCENVGFIMV